MGFIADCRLVGLIDTFQSRSFGSRTQPRLERHIKSLEHFLLDAVGVAELLPIGNIALLFLDVHNKFLHQQQIVRGRFTEVLLTRLRDHHGIGEGVVVGFGKGVGVGVSTGFSSIGTGERVVVGVDATVGTGVVSATVGVATGAGVVVVVSGNLEQEQMQMVTTARIGSERCSFMGGRFSNSLCG